MPNLKDAKGYRGFSGRSEELHCERAIQTSKAVKIEQITQGGLKARLIKSKSGDALIEFLDSTGRVMSTSFFPHIEELMCFTPATLIMTPNGPRFAGDLLPGDLVVTRDNGAKELAWIGEKSLGIGSLIANPTLAPVTIAAGALGHGLPAKTLVVSPNHRFLIRERSRGVMSQDSEALIAAQNLIGRPGITQAVPNAVTYLHLMFDQHELILSDGAWSESFQPTKAAIRGVDSLQKTDLFALFPALETENSNVTHSAVRPFLKEHDANYLSKRGMENTTHLEVV